MSNQSEFIDAIKINDSLKEIDIANIKSNLKIMHLFLANIHL